MQEKLLKLLQKNARHTNEELATMLGVTAQQVEDEIERLEKSGILCGFTTIINEEKLSTNNVTARIEVKVMPAAKVGYRGIAKLIAQFPEVETVYLMSGGYDLGITVTCADIQQIGRFVSDKLSAIDGVMGVVTHFIIGRYKQSGEIFDMDEDERELGTI